MTDTEIIRWLRHRADEYDLRREMHARSGASLAAGVAAVQAATMDKAAADLEKAVACETPVVVVEVKP